VVVIYFSMRWCIILDSCTLRFGCDSDFHKAGKDEFVSSSSWIHDLSKNSICYLSLHCITK
jgi:hypothetical protein